MNKTLFALLTLSALLLADFTRSNDIVTDNNTKLQWQDDIGASSTVLYWQNAIDYCEALTLGGNDDWRLPNIRELKSIVDVDRNGDAAIFDAFQNNQQSYYWSSTTHISSSIFAWIIPFSSCDDAWQGKENNGYVRCVRTGE